MFDIFAKSFGQAKMVQISNLVMPRVDAITIYFLYFVLRSKSNSLLPDMYELENNGYFLCTRKKPHSSEFASSNKPILSKAKRKNA